MLHHQYVNLALLLLEKCCKLLKEFRVTTQHPADFISTTDYVLLQNHSGNFCTLDNILFPFLTHSHYKPLWLFSFPWDFPLSTLVCTSTLRD